MTDKKSVSRIVYHTVAPVLTAGVLFFGIGKAVGGKSNSSKSNNDYGPRIRALEISEARSDERWDRIKAELVEIKGAIGKLSEK